jgi:hypothetical protein
LEEIYKFFDRMLLPIRCWTLTCCLQIMGNSPGSSKLVFTQSFFQWMSLDKVNKLLCYFSTLLLGFWTEDMSNKSRICLQVIEQ